MSQNEEVVSDAVMHHLPEWTHPHLNSFGQDVLPQQTNKNILFSFHPDLLYMLKRGISKWLNRANCTMNKGNRERPSFWPKKKKTNLLNKKLNYCFHVHSSSFSFLYISITNHERVTTPQRGFLFSLSYKVFHGGLQLPLISESVCTVSAKHSTPADLSTFCNAQRHTVRIQNYKNTSFECVSYIITHWE